MYFGPLIIFSFCCVSTVFSLTVRPNHSVVSVRENQTVNLVCSVDSAVSSCIYRTPDERTFIIASGSRYESGRIVFKEGSTDRECAITINGAIEKDNGRWECSVVVTDQNGDSVTDNGFVNVTIAVPPRQVYLRYEDQKLQSEFYITKNKTQSVLQSYIIDCVAEDGRPEPFDFRWKIGGTVIDARKHRYKQVTGNRVTVVEQLTYFASYEHNEKLLECEVDHKGYNLRQIEEHKNVAAVKLILFFKPLQQEKENIFYNREAGATEDIMINFVANPKPTEIVWDLVGLNETLSMGTESADKRFKSSDILDGDIPDQYRMELTIKSLDKKMAGADNKLIVTNAVGTTEYVFKITLDAPPPSEPLGSGPVIVIVVVLLVVLLIIVIGVVARAKGCSGGSSEGLKEDTERAVDKEGSDTESAEETHGANAEVNISATNNVGMRRITSLLSAVKNSVRPKQKRKNETEPKENDNSKNREDGNGKDINYVELDKSALGTGNPTVTNESEKTQYMEIKSSDKKT